MKVVPRFFVLIILIALSISTLCYSASDDIGINELIMEEITDNVDNPYLKIPINLGFFTFNLKVTKHAILIFLAAIVTIVSVKYLEHKLKRPFNKPTILQGILEVLVDYMSRDVLEPTLGEKAKKYLPFCLTIFLFVLFSNLIGIIPLLIKIKAQDSNHFYYLSGSVGANLGFTLAVSIIVFFVYNIAGMRKKGIIKYWLKLAPSNLPIILVPFLWLIEFITLLNRALALSIRLFANMAGGHIMIIVIPYLIIMSQTLVISPFILLFLCFIYILEIFVAVLQAYVFALLSSVYIGLAVNEDH